jgi:single-stranded-DNA-specific exonuclease
LKLFPECDIPAIRLLNEKFAPVNAKSVAWNISPLLNTPGRIGRTELSASLLLSRDAEECETILSEISDLNDERKDFLKEKLSVYTKELSSGADRGAKNFIYIKAPDVTDGYTGLIAGRLADAHGCPAVVVSAVQGKEIFKGSGRASGGIDFLSRVEPFSTRFERFGGHASAFGFSAKESEIDAIMREVDLSLEGVVLQKKARVADLEIDDTGVINVKALDVLSLCEPFGAGNEPPLFLSRCVPVLRFETFGSGGRHGKFFCGGRNTPAIGWGMADLMKEYDFSEGADFLYSAEFDQYTKRVRFVIEELL